MCYMWYIYIQMELDNWLCTKEGGDGACSPDEIVLIDSPAKTSIILNRPHQFAILSYHYLTKLEGILCAKKYKMIIIDESHFLKNGKAKRTKSMKVIAESAPRVTLHNIPILIAIALPCEFSKFPLNTYLILLFTTLTSLITHLPNITPPPPSLPAPLVYMHRYYY